MRQNTILVSSVHVFLSTSRSNEYPHMDRVRTEKELLIVHSDLAAPSLEFPVNSHMEFNKKNHGTHRYNTKYNTN
jgi:hypothetical protein